jgi:hypothetical protein
MRVHPLLIAIGLAASVSAQEPSAPSTSSAPAAPAPTLTAEQITNVLKQLEELEKSVMQQRGTNLGAIIQRLRSAASSDAAAINLLAESDKLVNVERKDGERSDSKRIDQKKEAMKREKPEDEKKNGDRATGLRIELEYLALTLEAHDVKNLATMAPKITAFHQMLLAQAKDLKGATGEALMRPLGGGGRRGGGGGALSIDVVIEAYQLEPFMRREGWPMAPADIIGIYDKLLLKPIREKKKEDIGSTWDTAMNLDASIRKARMFEQEFTLWQTNEYPQLKWQRATDLAMNGSNPVSGMAEMLKVIKEYPGHSSSPAWIKSLREMVKPGGLTEDTTAEAK